MQRSPWVSASGIAVGCLVAVACGPSAPAKTADKAVQATNLTSPSGTALEQTCTPSGPELCFNAIDDNCNGVIDEGCGIPTGLFQFEIAWGAAAADVNLTLKLPSDERVDHGHPSVGGFRHDRDCPADDGCNGQNVEDVYYEASEPPRGHYVAEISLVDLHGADAPVRVRFSARLGARTTGFYADLSPGDDSKKTFAFDLP